MRKSLVLFLFLPLLLDYGHADQLHGGLTGRVTVASPLSTSDLEIMLINPRTEYSKSARIRESGWFDLSHLPNGTCTLRVVSSRFGYCDTENVPVRAGEITRLDLNLDVGPNSQIRCSADFSAAGLKTENATVSAQLTSQEISNLPLAFLRNYQSALVLVPGAAPLERQDDITDSTGLLLAFYLNGSSGSANVTRVDGATGTNIWLPRHAAYIPPADTIELINISTNNIEADQGFAGGSAITVLTRSGTNELHGSLLGYHENSALNARNFFNHLDTDGDGKADQPGGQRSIGSATFAGPLVKDKLFFFGGWEGAFQRQARTSTATVPTEEQRNGDFSAFDTSIYDPLTGKKDVIDRLAFENNVIPASRPSAQAKAAQSLLPLPNLKDPDSDEYLL
ncbi:MAG: carboxypeptidase regulatory-like domain-containing protein, partial [Acidobacteria bacterium]